VEPWLLLVAAGGGFALGGTIVAVALRSRATTSAEVEARSRHRVTERARLSARELDRMAVVLSAMREGVVLFDPDGRTAFSNPSAAIHLGVTPRSIDAVLPTALQETVRRSAAEHAGASSESEVGSPARWIRGAATPVGDDGSVLLVVSDVTEARRLDAVRRDFVANASHELKTPAATILATAETIVTAAADDPAVVPRFADQLQREAFRLSRIVGDLLDLSRLEAGSDLGQRVRLAAVLREEVARFDDEIARSGIRMTLDADEGAVLAGSERDLALLARNLLDNAIRYTPPDGAVDVTLLVEDDHVILAIVDTGVGIPQRDLARIFERFYRVDRARSRETGGTGLGLSIVRHVVENHGGTISVASELGRGTQVEVRLPAVPVAGQADGAAAR
jgi:signal transduction histidine kinase